jgi:hypothetical protein
LKKSSSKIVVFFSSDNNNNVPARTRASYCYTHHTKLLSTTTHTHAALQFPIKNCVDNTHGRHSRRPSCSSVVVVVVVFVVVVVPVGHLVVPLACVRADDEPLVRLRPIPVVVVRSACARHEKMSVQLPAAHTLGGCPQFVLWAPEQQTFTTRRALRGICLVDEQGFY